MRMLLAAVIVISLSASSAMAAIEKGKSEIGLSLSFKGGGFAISDPSGGPEATFSTSNQTATFSYGYFVSQKSQIGASLMFTRNTFVSNDDPNAPEPSPGNGFLGFFYRYHFIGSNPKMVPFAGAGFIKSFEVGGDADSPSPSIFGYGINAGLKTFLSEKTAVGPELHYDITNVSQEFSGTTYEGKGHDVTLALTLTTLF